MPDVRAQTPHRHEVADVDGRRIVWIAAGLVTTLVAVALIAWAVLALVRSDQPSPRSARAPSSRMPAPQLQSAPSRDLRALREEKQGMLTGYRWLDRKAGVVQIPIDRAMQLMAARSEAAPHATGKKPEPAR